MAASDVNFDELLQTVRSGRQDRTRKRSDALRDKKIAKLAERYRVPEDVLESHVLRDDSSFTFFIVLKSEEEQMEDNTSIMLRLRSGPYPRAEWDDTTDPSKLLFSHEIKSQDEFDKFQWLLVEHAKVCKQDETRHGEIRLAHLMNDFLCYIYMKNELLYVEDRLQIFNSSFTAINDNHLEEKVFHQRVFSKLAEAYGFAPYRFKCNGYGQIYIHLNLTRQRKDPSFFMRYTLFENEFEVTYDRKPLNEYEEYDRISAATAIELIQSKYNSLPPYEQGIACMFIRYLTNDKLSPEPMTKSAVTKSAVIESAM